MLSVSARRDLRRLLRFDDLHASLPVDIESWARRHGWEIWDCHTFERVKGCALIANKVRAMAINANLNSSWRRFTIAHEAAHELGGHHDTMFLMAESPFANGRQEAEANEIAAELLVPDWAVFDYREFPAIAAACDVPEDLIWIKIRKVRL